MKQTKYWYEKSLTADLEELEHVIVGHLENELPVEALLRIDHRRLAEICLLLRNDLFRESNLEEHPLERDLADWKPYE